MRIRRLGYALIESTNPAQWREFGTEVLGMMVAPTMPEGDTIYLKMDERPFRYAIVPGDVDRLQLVGWELIDEADFEAADLVDVLRTNVKKLPSRYVGDQGGAATNADPLQSRWNELTNLIEK